MAINPKAPVRIFISAGEASGDAYGAALVDQLRQRDASLSFEGFGGKRMIEAGVNVIADSSRWGAISIVQGLRVVPRLYASYYRTKLALRRGKSGLFIPIDFGFANIKLARHAKNCGWKVLYFIPPGSWRRDRQGGDLPAVTDQIVTPFDFSAELLNKMGATAHWFGHPIKQLIANRAPQTGEKTHIAVLPGSRDSEIEMHLPLVAAAITDPIEFALAPSIDVHDFINRWTLLAGVRPNDKYTQGDLYGVLDRARAALVCSGTATLEAALCRCPMVVFYMVSKATVVESKIIRFKRPKYFSLPNIIMNEAIVPELIQEDATPENIRKAVYDVLRDSRAQLAGFDRLCELLGPADAITQTADLALQMMLDTPPSLDAFAVG